jgi:hypothetical protein
MVVRRGAEEAGAIFIIMDRIDGVADLYGPAPQSSFDDERPAERLFQKITERANPVAVNERLDREKRFDPDLWIVAVEDREGRLFFETVAEDRPR